MKTITSMTADLLHQGDIPLGAHLVTPRRGYMHHGIYIQVDRLLCWPKRMAQAA